MSEKSRIDGSFGEQNTAGETLDFRVLAETLPHLVWSAWADGAIDYHNARFLHYHGRNLEGIKGWAWVDIVHPDDRQRSIDAWTKALTWKTDFLLEHRLRRADGAYRWHEVRAAPLCDAAGNITRWLGTCTDIQDRKQEAITLKRYGKIFQHVSDLVVVAGEDGYLKEVNPAFIRTLGYSEAELKSRPLVSFIHPDDRQATMDEMARQVQGPAVTLDFQNRYLCKDGSARLFAWNAYYLQEERIFLGIARDITERSRVEEALRRSEEQLRVALAAGRMGTWVLDVAAGTVQTDALHRQLWDLPAEAAEVSASEILGRVHPEDCGKVMLPERLAEAGGSFDGEFRMVRRNGEVRWLHGAAAPLHGSDGSVKKIVGVNFDITGRKSVEAALRASEEQFRVMFEVAPIGMSQADAGGRLLRVNRKFAKIVGLPMDKLLGMRFAQFTHPDDRDRDSTLFQRLWRGEAPNYFCEKRYLLPGGAVIWVRVNAAVVRDAAGLPLRTVATIEDITARRQLDEALRAALAKAENGDRLLAALMEHVPEGISVVDADFNLIRVSRYGQELLGAALNGRSVQDVVAEWDVFHADGTTPLAFDDFPLVRAVRRGEVVHDAEIVQVNGRGEKLPLLCTAAPFFDSGGKIVGGIVAYRDISERKQAENFLREAKAGAEEASRAKSEFLANMSHEIRTPMTIFMVAIEHLLHLDDDPERRQLLGMAEQSAERLRVLIDDILDLSRVEARRLQVEAESYDLRACVRQAVDMFLLPAGEKGLRLITEIAVEIPAKIVGDSDRVGQVLVNLIGNAVKFTREGEVRVSVRADGDFLGFTVADTGIGIPEKKIDQLFQSFSQVDSSITRSFGGSGLGLAISRGLVELMGGRISVQSRLGQGSVFTFTLPLQPAGKEKVWSLEDGESGVSW